MVAPRDSVKINVMFYPLAIGQKSAHLILMHDQNSQPDTILIDGTGIGSGSEVSVIDSFGLGWQLVSLPMNSSCPYVLKNSFLFNDIYRAVDTLSLGIGYWNKLKKPKLMFAGNAVTQETLQVNPLWNIIGSISKPVAVSQITSDPPGMVTSQFFGYNGAYFVTDSLYPGKAYWVKVNQSGELIVSSSPDILTARINIVPLSETPPSPPDADVTSKIKSIPTSYALVQNYPNPFNPETEIKYDLPVHSFVKLVIYSVLGQEVKTLVNEAQEAGFKSISFHAGSLPSGVYFYSLQAGGFSEVKKLLLVK